MPHPPIVRLDSTKGTYAKEWTKWEKQLRATLSRNAEYLISNQVNRTLLVAVQLHYHLFKKKTVFLFVGNTMFP